MNTRNADLLALPRYPVESSNIDAIAHDGKSTLVVQFKRNVVWSYFPVTMEAFAMFRDSDSKGKWFNDNIRTNENVSSEKI